MATELYINQCIDRILQKNPLYTKDAYRFIYDGVNFAHTKICQRENSKVRDVQAPELCSLLAEYIQGELGPMALHLLHEWGIYQTNDFGEIIFFMVEERLLSASADDNRSDFDNHFDFEDVFVKPFKPSFRDVDVPMIEF
ncbi:MAG: hypothetical protein HRT89_08875 [Lentisphaeria bacterium]|nr:hypothetical protein [Lentisphaeria bacterium]